jgi:hypothetical protein
VTFIRECSFDFDQEGERALIFIEQDDLVAWPPDTGKLGTWCRGAFALNEDAIWNPAAYFMGSALRVHRTPLEWLSAERDGIVIVQPQLAYAMLRDIPRIIVDDVQLARQIRRWLEPPESHVEILINSLARVAA